MRKWSRGMRGIILGGLVVVLAVVSIQPVFSQESGDTSDRAFLQYEVQKMDPWGPFALNLLLGLGIGSFVQGDTTGGLLVAGGEVLGVGLMVAGYSSAVNDPGSGGTIVLVGAGLLVAARIAGLVFPFTYANSFNEKLRGDLGISVADVSIVPGHDELGYGINVTFAIDA